MSVISEKRTYDSWLYDFDCSALLSPGEVITSIVSVACDDPAIGLICSYPIVSPNDVVYKDGHLAPSGQVIQVQIGGGTIPVDADSLGLGVPNVLCTVRAKFQTNFSPDQGDATVLILLQDQILPL